MTVSKLIYSDPSGSNRHRIVSLLFLLAWTCIVLILAWDHVVWRDEVRALTFALQGDNVIAMLRALRGESHPAVWFLLLRGAHFLFPRPEVLPIVAFGVAFATMLLLVLRSPFSLLLIALVLLSRFGLFEYVVMARDYGISMLALFALAILYERHKQKGIVLGVLLFVLANCNSHSVLLTGAFLLFWFCDILWRPGEARAPALRNFFINAAVAAIGIAASVLTLYPTVHDAIAPPEGGATFGGVLRAIFLPAQVFDRPHEGFSDVLFVAPRRALEELSLWQQPYIAIFHVLISALLFGSTLGLIRRPAALIASLAALIAFSLFFTLVYPGVYRHQALWLVFLLSMYWIAGRRGEINDMGARAREKSVIRSLRHWGIILFVALMALQPVGALQRTLPYLLGYPESRARDVAELIAQHPELQESVIIADPDYLVETLPYYLSNRTYILRERRFGQYTIFTKKLRIRISLEDILADARKLREQTGRPVVILLRAKLEPAPPPQVIKEGYVIELAVTPEDAVQFRASTKRLAQFGRVSSDETYDVYVLE